MKSLLALVVFSVILISSSCATIVDPGPDRLSVNSNPEGATVSYNGEKVGETPVEVELDRSKTAVLTFEKAGYNSVSVIPSKVLNGWALVGGILILVDVALENVNKYSEKPLTVTLTQK